MQYPSVSQDNDVIEYEMFSRVWLGVVSEETVGVSLEHDSKKNKTIDIKSIFTIDTLLENYSSLSKSHGPQSILSP